MSVTICILEINFAINSMSYVLWFSEYNYFLPESLLKNYKLYFLSIICQQYSGANFQAQSTNGNAYFQLQV